ncbi:MAG: insulinase family protein [Candidatus Cardinium sp.]|uniref:insulinase family protein n=1 Tax=Cardinium endosymbiont of Dermatophagoides farinae TaxID=2597823 RepID=UPI001182B9B9|nr:insulinase family protein [Cardinium endosymbiont of Dermatophagoides farinae]TSJ81176.1 hypothetical protein FPG78_04200 [Cardinium endosymbiont of Dermatophagoides farinae]UWW97222.1 MAG: insulinase family protein [Candidatus Cardinium sp.]
MGRHNAFFQVRIILTDQGVAQIPLVIQRCFETLAGFRNTGIPSYLFEEMIAMRKLFYQYQPRKDAFKFIMDHSRDFLYEPLVTYPAKTLLPSRYEPQKVQSLVEFLQPENCQYYMLAHAEKTKVRPDRKEKWLGGEYAVRAVPEAQLSAWKAACPHPAIVLPKRNLFVPSKLQLLPVTKSTVPLKIADNKHGKAFYFKDNVYQTPEVVHLVHIKSPLIDGTPRSATLMDLYLASIQDKLSPLLASAAAAGLKAHFEHARNSFKIKISGFSDKARVFLKEVLKELTRVKPQSSDFELYCASLSKCYENAQKKLPVQQAGERLFSILQKTRIASIEKLKELDSLTYQDFLAFHSKLFAQTYIEGFFSGNLTIKEAKNCWFDLKQLLGHTPFPKELHPKGGVFCLSDQGPYLVEEQTTAQGNGIILAIDQGAFSFEKRAAQAMLAIALQEAFFTTLRTKQETGYIVWSWGQEIEKRLFQFFAVQSNSHHPQDLLCRFELFLENCLQEMPHDIPMERFETIRENYLLTLKNLFPNLQDKAVYLDALAFKCDGDFKWLDKQIAAAKALRYEDFLKYAKEFFSRENRKRLAVAVSGKLPETHNFSYKARSASGPFKEGKYATGFEK